MDPKKAGMTPISALKELRAKSKYLIERRKKIPFTGGPRDLKEKKIIAASEEYIILFLPLVKFARQTKSDLFFIERSAYPQKLAVDFILAKQKIKSVKSYSHKIAQGANPSLCINDELASTVGRFLNHYTPMEASRLFSGSEKQGALGLWAEIPASKRSLLIQNNKLLRDIDVFDDKQDLLLALIKAEAPVFLDETREAVYLNRSDSMDGVPCRVRNGEKIEITREIFGKDDSRFREYIFKKMRALFPAGVNKINCNSYLVKFYGHTKDYLLKESHSFDFVSSRLMRYIARSLGVNLKNIIYCDDIMGSGNSFFKAWLFHKILATGAFRYNTFSKSISPVDLGETRITDSSIFPEDVPEMFDFYYDNLERRGYKSVIEELKLTLDAGIGHRYGGFLKSVNKLIISSSDKLQRIFMKITGLAQAPLEEKAPRQYLNFFYRSIAFYLIDPNFFTEELVRTIGHNRLVNILKEEGKLNLPEKLEREYAQVKNFHTIKIIEYLLRLHQQFHYTKLLTFSDFFEEHAENVEIYLNRGLINNKELAETSGFEELARIFYNYIETKNVSNSGF